MLFPWFEHACVKRGLSLSVLISRREGLSPFFVEYVE